MGYGEADEGGVVGHEDTTHRAGAVGDTRKLIAFDDGDVGAVDALDSQRFGDGDSITGCAEHGSATSIIYAVGDENGVAGVGGVDRVLDYVGGSVPI